MVLLLLLCSVQHHHDEIRRLGDGNDLSAAASTVSGTFDNAREVQQLHHAGLRGAWMSGLRGRMHLDLDAIVVDVAGDAGEGRELLLRLLALRVGQHAAVGSVRDKARAHSPNSGIACQKSGRRT